MDVKVKAERIDGQIKWTIDDKEPKKSVIDLPKGSGRHTLDFHLDDKTGSGLSFAENPIWVHETEGGECPDEGIKTDQIRVEAIKAKKLSISNENAGPGRTLQYQLNFVDEAGVLCTVDPAIRNGGGT